MAMVSDMYNSHSSGVMSLEAGEKEKEEKRTQGVKNGLFSLEWARADSLWCRKINPRICYSTMLFHFFYLKMF